MSRSAGWVYDARWRKVRKLVLDRDRYECRIRAAACTFKATQVDHIVPPRLGGSRYDPVNLRASCAECNRGRQNRVSPGPRPSREW